MAYLTRRLFTTTSFKRTSAAEACTELFDRFSQGERPISMRRKLLDANQFQLLSTTLGRNSTSYEAPKEGTPIPPGYHLVYFTPSIPEQELGRDGTDRTVNPLSPYTRRMWAGGELEWSQDTSSLLKVGQTVTETTKILSAEPKKLKNGGEMIVVGVEKIFETEQGLALMDRRNWVFQKEIGPENPLTVMPTPEEKALPEGLYVPSLMLTKEISKPGYVGNLS
jgi:hydroxyacyl-ACP dehydratase HTD2-like protein with hotdog domain